MELTPWHVLAQLFENKEIDMGDIVRVMMISTAVGLIDDVWEKAGKVGLNVIDNTVLNDSLVLGLLTHQPPDKPITYRQMADLLQKHPQTVGSAVNRMIARGYLSKTDYGAAGAFYTIHEDIKPYLPVWIIEFTRALIELANDPELKAQAVAKCETIGFDKGLQALRKELREKFYRRQKPENPKPE